MSWESVLRCCLALAAGVALCGCGPTTSGTADEEKEPQFLIGRTRVNDLDYRGAVEAFEQALEANPRSASAHFELGCLFAAKVPDPAAAIYHFQQFLKLRPESEKAETIRQHIARQKVKLAEGVMAIPSSAAVQRQLEQLAEENRRLHEELDQLRAAQTLVAPVGRQASVVVGPANNIASRANVVASVPSERTATTTTARTHRVQAGETPSAIARRYHVQVDALLSANPGLNAKRLQIGQRLVIPGR